MSVPKNQPWKKKKGFERTDGQFTLMVRMGDEGQLFDGYMSDGKARIAQEIYVPTVRSTRHGPESTDQKVALLAFDDATFVFSEKRILVSPQANTRKLRNAWKVWTQK